MAKKAEKQSDMMSVVTLPMKTEIWQEDRLEKMFELYRVTYNAMLGNQIKKYRKMLRDERYIKSRNYINDVYRMSDEKAKKEAKKSDEYKEMVQLNRDVLKEYGMSEFGFGKEGTVFRQHFKENLSSTCVGYSIAKPMWAAFDSLLFGNGEKVKFKKKGDFRSICSDLKSGIRIVNADGETLYTRDGNKKLFVAVGSGKKRKMIIPIMIDEKDLFKVQMLDRPYRTGRIIREKVKGRYRYSIQLTVEGAPAPKLDAKTGEFKHYIGKGHCGVYIDTTKCVVAAQDKITTIDLSDGIISYEEKRAAIDVFLDTSRRISNPDNYNEDGTIKKGIIWEDGKRHRLHWQYSKNYQEARDKRSDLYRKEAETRRIRRNILSNMILSMGDSFTVNDYPFEYAARRKKEDEFTESGRPKSKAKAGKVIGENAPAEVITLLDNKLKANGLEGVVKVKLSDVDYSKHDYREEMAVRLRG